MCRRVLGYVSKPVFLDCPGSSVHAADLKHVDYPQFMSRCCSSGGSRCKTCRMIRESSVACKLMFVPDLRRQYWSRLWHDLGF